MPSHIYHQILREMLMGKDRSKGITTDHVLDAPFRFYGRKHRKYFHSLNDLIILSMLSNNPRKFLREALLHVFLDKYGIKGYKSEGRKYLL